MRLSLSIASPAAGATVNGAFTGATFNVTGSASVTSGGGSISRVEVKVGEGAYQMAALSGSNWTLANASATAPGELLITARATHSGHFPNIGEFK